MKVFYRLEIGAHPGAEGARIRWNDQNAFSTIIAKDIISNVASVVDCVDTPAELVGYQDLAAKGPEAQRWYGWSFQKGGGVRDEGGNSGAGNLPDGAVLTGHDQVVAKCAHVVEGDPGVVRSAVWQQRKGRDDAPCDLIDRRTLCDENVARGEPGIHRLGWSDSDVFFSTVTEPRKRGQQRDVALAVDGIDIVAAVFGCDQVSPRSGHAVRRIDSGKGSWIGSVKDYCQR